MDTDFHVPYKLNKGIGSVDESVCFRLGSADKAKQSKAKMCNGRRHVPLCPASANEK